MQTRIMLGCALIWLGLLAAAEAAPTNAAAPRLRVKWQEGPCTGALGRVAAVRVAADHVFADGADTRRLMEAMHNPTSGTEVGFLAPASLDWFVVFEFDDVGYVRDDEKDSLDADAMLQRIKRGNEEANKERARRGWSPLTITGWEQPPRYNQATHNLEWAIRGAADGKPVVNWNTRLLGRGGVMRVTLVTGPERLQETLPQFNAQLTGFTFTPGHRYAEYRQGDKLAKYGLSALVVGGATAVAVKTGMFKWLWKLIVLAAVGLGTFFKKVFSGRKGGPNPA